MPIVSITIRKPFKELKKGDVLQANTDKDKDPVTLTCTQLLESRGQPGKAAFFKDNFGQEYLVKTDKPGVVLFEGTAHFAQKQLPKKYQDTVNFASVVTLKENKETKIATIQPKVTPTKNKHTVTSWDVAITGKKREPNTLFSTEWWSTKDGWFSSIKNNALPDHINHLSDKASWDLAYALYISTMVGDESVHIGQYMAVLNDVIFDNNGNIEQTTKNNLGSKILKIIRVDFGARERFGILRLLHDDFKHQTSEYYKNSGQKGKDYISFLFPNPLVKLKYLCLWAQDIDIKSILNAHVNSVKAVLKAMEDGLQKTAIYDALEILYKNLPDATQTIIPLTTIMELDLNGKKTQLLTLINDVTQKRLGSLQRAAREQLLEEIQAPLTEIRINNIANYKALLDDCIEHTPAKLFTVIDELRTTLSSKENNHTLVEQAQHGQTIVSILLMRFFLIEEKENLGAELKKGLQKPIQKLKHLNLQLSLLTLFVKENFDDENEADNADTNKMCQQILQAETRAEIAKIFTIDRQAKFNQKGRDEFLALMKTQGQQTSPPSPTVETKILAM